MKIIELKEQSENQLQLLIKESKEKLNEFRFSLTNKQLKDYSQIKKTKITIARAKSILKEREINSKITEK
ncbi:MAG: 50S ribosomal protein L29 [Candidatus Pacebacteria bacterium]|nr:50S ribosomal protein L29 [Candidatus Paceibacterota bacterium]